MAKARNCQALIVETPCNFCYGCDDTFLSFSIGQWSSTSPVDQAHGFDLSDAEGNFTVSYLAKNQEGTTGAYSVLKRSIFLCWWEGI